VPGPELTERFEPNRIDRVDILQGESKTMKTISRADHVAQLAAARSSSGRSNRLNHTQATGRSNTWRSLLLFIGGVGVIAVAFGTLSANAHTVPSAARTVLRFKELYTNVTYVPVQTLLGSKSSTNNGDQISFSDKVVNPGTQKSMGTISGSCVVINAKTNASYCSGVTVTLHGMGSVSSDGIVPGTGPAGPYGIFGGTGRFRGAVGTLRSIVNTSTSTLWELRYSK
jgi:hypothetical protein